MTPSSPLSIARTEVEDARANFTHLKSAFHRAEATAKLAGEAARNERLQKTQGAWGGAPRGAPGPKPPTALETAAANAKTKFEAAERAYIGAQNALNAVEAALLTIENGILNRWRDKKAFAIRQVLNAGAPSEHVEALLADLKELCPPDSMVRLNQQFTLSLQVRELLDAHQDTLRVNTPVNELRGEGHLNYEARRAAILDASETEFNASLAVA
jgi:hypothetical protein